MTGRIGRAAPYFLLPLAVGGLSALLSRGGMRDFSALARPPLSPPAWLFPVTWTALYLLMGWAFFRFSAAPGDAGEKRRGALLYYGQLALNFFWSIWFFVFRLYFFAFLWLAALWVLILLTARAFFRLSRPAGAALLPYLLWVSFAGYLNLGVWLLN